MLYEQDKYQVILFIPLLMSVDLSLALVELEYRFGNIKLTNTF